MLTLKELIKKLQEIPNQDREILFYAELSQDPDDNFTLQFKEVDKDKTEVYIILQDY